MSEPRINYVFLQKLYTNKTKRVIVVINPESSPWNKEYYIQCADTGTNFLRGKYKPTLQQQADHIN